MFFPYKIETLFKHWPIANWLIIAAIVLIFVGSLGWSDGTLQGLILGGTSPVGLITHLFLHAGFVHLAGNLLFLWVFGNAVCAMTSNLVYPFLFTAFGVLAAAAHLAFDGSPAIGASGAINGIVGMAVAMYPLNKVHVFWFVIARAGTFEMPLWVLALVWLAFDAYGAFFGDSMVAYWGHLGGLFAGVLVGMIALRLRWVTLTKYDNASLAECLVGKHRRTEETKAESYRRRRYEAMKD